MIDAIRETGADQLILVPNSRGSDVDHWATYSPNGGSLDSVAALTTAVPETQNFDPVGFERVHDNYRTFDEGAKIGSFSNTMSRFRKCAQHLEPLTKPCYESLCGRRVSLAIKSLISIRSASAPGRLILFPTEPLLQAFHNVFQRIFRFVFRGPDSFVHSRKEFGAFFNILSVKPVP
jgi:hypothetical protein